MSALSGIRSFFRGYPSYVQANRNIGRAALQELPPRDLYAALRAAYQNNGLYEALQQQLFTQGDWSPAMRALRNPAYRSVEFFASKVLAGKLEIETDNQAIVDPISHIHKWSNFGDLKLVYTRWAAMLGDAFLKVSVRADRSRVYLQLIDPASVVDFDTDDRGFITWIRVEVMRSDRLANGSLDSYLHIEVWDKALGTYRRWRITETQLLMLPPSQQAALTDLGAPAETIELAQMGIDFLPFVHAKFRDVGEDRGNAAILPAWDKIDEANRMATRLHQMLFRSNKTTWAVESAGRDASGRMIPPPAVDNKALAADDTGTVTVGDDVMVRLPAGWTLRDMVPQLAYADALAILNAQMNEIEKDLPELAYYELRDQAQLSGVAVRLLLSDAIDRAEEARGNLEQALVRAQQMGLTIGAAAGLFSGLGGTFDGGAFDHTFKERDILPLSDQEIAQTELTRAQAFSAYRTAGLPVVTSLERLGYQGDELTTVAEAMVAAADAQAPVAGVQ